MVGLEGVTQVTVDVFALGMAETDEQLYRKTTTLMTNDPEVADAFRPYRFKRTHERVNLLVEAEAHEVLRNTLNSSNCNEGVSPPSRSSDPSQPVTLAVRGVVSQLTKDETRTLHLRTTSPRTINNLLEHESR